MIEKKTHLSARSINLKFIQRVESTLNKFSLLPDESYKGKQLVFHTNIFAYGFRQCHLNLSFVAMLQKVKPQARFKTLLALIVVLSIAVHRFTVE